MSSNINSLYQNKIRNTQTGNKNFTVNQKKQMFLFNRFKNKFIIKKPHREELPHNHNKQIRFSKQHYNLSSNTAFTLNQQTDKNKLKPTQSRWNPLQRSINKS